MSDICIILTGGTIDKHYDPVTQTNLLNTKSVLPTYFQDIIKPHPSLAFETFSMLDSNDIDDAMLDRLAALITAQEAHKILVTYGTDRMAYAAQYLTSRITSKTVILTGSMIPMKEFAMSDGGFNLGFALASLNTQPAGVYLAMHGKCFTPDQVRKNHDIAKFEVI